MVSNVRVLVNKGGDVVNLVVDGHVEILLGVVAGDLGEGEFLGVRHDGCDLETGARWCQQRLRVVKVNR